MQTKKPSPFQILKLIFGYLEIDSRFSVFALLVFGSLLHEESPETATAAGHGKDPQNWRRKKS